MTPEDTVEPPRPIERRMTLAREWDELVDDIRDLPGFADFLRPPRIASLLPAAANGWVVFVNVSRWRCDALALGPRGVEAIELPTLSHADVSSKTDIYLRAVQEFQVASAQYGASEATTEALHRYRDAQVIMEQALTMILKWLWDNIAEPVFAAIGLTRAPGPDDTWPRLWWCPTGLLSLLPLHAAGYHEPSTVPYASSVPDRAVCSYTPTLRALIKAAATTPRSVAAEQLLVVALRETPGQTELPNVTRERDFLAGLFGDRQTLLEGPGATRAAVMEALSRHRWVHFSCHGDHDFVNPSQAGLVLHDGPVTVTDFGTGRYHGEFAFLAACKTAAGARDLPDEAITLASALNYTGYQHVVATLWSVGDASAAAFTEAVYTDLTRTGTFDPSRAAEAVHRATRRMRDERPYHPSCWIPFTHTGP